MIIERCRRAHLVNAIQGDDQEAARLLRLFFPKLDPDQTLQRIQDARNVWQDDRYQAEQIIADIIQNDKENRHG